MKNDQYFEPGDKVMRVTAGDKLFPRDIFFGGNGLTSVPYGAVVCVSWFEADAIANRVAFSGIDRVFLAACFRKVEEIKLCVNAVKSVKQKELT